MTHIIFLDSEEIENLIDKKILVKDKQLYKPTTAVLFARKPGHPVSVSSSGAWIDEWRELFPQGINTSTNVAYRGDRKECIKKMDALLKTNPVTKELIFAATRKAINDAKSRNFEYFPAAHYFIEKKGSGSRLLQYIETADFESPQDKTVI